MIGLFLLFAWLLGVALGALVTLVYVCAARSRELAKQLEHQPQGRR